LLSAVEAICSYSVGNLTPGRYRKEGCRVEVAKIA
jgi:hypothetical protein